MFRITTGETGEESQLLERLECWCRSFQKKSGSAKPFMLDVYQWLKQVEGEHKKNQNIDARFKNIYWLITHHINACFGACRTLVTQKRTTSFCRHHHFILCEEVIKCSLTILSRRMLIFTQSELIKQSARSLPIVNLDLIMRCSIEPSSIHSFWWLTTKIVHDSWRMPEIRCSQKQVNKRTIQQ